MNAPFLHGRDLHEFVRECERFSAAEKTIDAVHQGIAIYAPYSMRAGVQRKIREVCFIMFSAC